MANQDETVTVGLGVDPDDLKRITALLEAALIKATGPNSAFAKSIKNTFGGAARATDPLEAALKNIAKALDKLSVKSKDALNPFSKQMILATEAAKRLGHATELIARQLSTTKTLGRQAQINERQRLISETTLQKEAIRAQSAAQFQALQNQGSAHRQAARQRIVIFQAMSAQLLRLESALGRAISGIARTTTSAISRTFSSFGRGLNNIFGRGGVNSLTGGLSSNLTTRERLLSSSFRSQERLLQSSATRQSTIIQRMNQQASRGVAGAVTGRGVGGGILGPLAAGAGVSTLLFAGFQRFSDLERINKQFIALTGSVEQANQLLAEAKEFAKTTPFDLVGVADLAKGFLTIGSSAEEAMKQVRIISDAVAFTGGGTDALTRIQRAIGQVVSAGRLQGDELNQLAENLPGLNIRKILADQLTGGDVRALVDLQESGELSAEMFVNGLMAGLGGDPRLVGAAQELANTLSGRFANLRESFADFGAAIIGTVAEPLKILASTIQTVLQSLADFIKGEGLSKNLEILRDALQGVALGMLAIVAAKGAVEVIKLLGTSLSLVFTPFGALLVTAGLIGGAISVLARRSEDMREALTGLGRYIQTQGKRIFEALGEAVDKIAAAFTQTDEAIEGTARVITGTAEPASRRFRDIADRIKEGLKAATDFLVDRFIPAMTTAVIFIGKNFVPAMQAAADAVEGAVRGVAHAVDQIAIRIRPALQPAIDGFRTLKLAIQDALDRDFSGLLPGLQAALGGIGTVIANTLGPLFSNIGDVFKRFTLDGLAENALNAVEEIGRILGRIATHPLVVKGLLAIAGIAAIVAVRFVEGLARGIAENFPALGDLLVDLLQGALKFAFDNLKEIVGIGLLAALFAPAVFSIFRGFGKKGGDEAGKEAGKAASKSFTQSWRSGFQRNSLLIRSFFNDQAFTQAAQKTAAKARVAFQKEFFANNALLKAAGQQVVGASRLNNVGLFVTPQQADKAKRLVADLTKGMDETTKSALRSKAAFQSMVTLAGSWAKSLTSGFAAAFQTARVNKGKGVFGSLSEAFAITMKDMQQAAVKAGPGIGAALGSNIKTGLMGALVALGGFQLGQAEGQSGGSGLMSAITGGLGAGLLLSAVPGVGTGAAVAIGATTAAVTLFGAALGRNKKAVEEHNRKIQELSASFAEDLVNGIKDGSIALDGLKIDLADLANSDDLKTTFFTELGEDGEDAFLKVGLSYEKHIRPILEQGGDNVGQKLADQFVDATVAASTFRDLFKGEEFDRVAEFLRGDPSGGGVFQLGLRSQAQTDFLTNIVHTLGDIEDFAGIAQEAINDLAEDIAIGKVVLPPILNAERRAEIAELNRAFAGLGSGLPAPDTTDFDREMAKAGAIVDVFQDQINQTRQDIDELFNFGGTTDFESALNDALLGANSFSGQIQTMIAEDMADGVRNGFSGLDLAEIETALRPVTASFATALQAGLEGGQITDAATARWYLTPIFQELTKGVTDPTLLAQLNTVFEGALTGLTPTLDELAGQEAAAKFLEDARTFMENNEGVTLKVAVETVVDKAITDLNVGHGFLPGEGAIGTGLANVIPNAMTPEMLAKVTSLSTDINTGLANGITDTTYLVENAQNQSALDGIAAAANRYGTRSPSTVFNGIGLNLMVGLAQGITSGGQFVYNAIRLVADRSIALAKKLFKINSPSLVTMEIGDSLAEGMALGLTQGAKRVDAAVSAVTARVASYGSTTSNETTIHNSPVNISQTFNRPVDSRAVAADTAWRLTRR